MNSEGRSAFLSHDISPRFRQAVLVSLAVFGLQAIMALIAAGLRGSFPLLPLVVPIFFGCLWAIFFQEAGRQGASTALLLAWLVLVVFVLASWFHGWLVYSEYRRSVLLRVPPQIAMYRHVGILVTDVIVVLISLRALLSRSVTPKTPGSADAS